VVTAIAVLPHVLRRVRPRDEDGRKV